jgi:DNA-binding IclR family transcriptional regulator
MTITENRKKLLENIPYYSWRKLPNIIEAVGLPYGTVRGNLRDLRKAGYVINSAQGWARTLTGNNIVVGATL